MLSVPEFVSAALSQSISLATENVALGGGPFGAVITSPDGVVATGVNRVTLDLDPTAHAEVCAIRNACREIGSYDLTGFTLVSSCEPCPLCLAASMWARVGSVFYAADRADAAAAGFDDAAFYELMDTPRSSWPSAPTQVNHSLFATPFDSWRALDSRIEY
ncbi:MAG: nucleoside deaminase [Actinomycetia bacterium]|nr:nucleoside deaminase [Actinomycetes bacterium]